MWITVKESSIIRNHAASARVVLLFACLLGALMPVSGRAAQAQSVGVSRYGLKGGDHVGILTDDHRELTIGAHGGYGVVESMGPVKGVHQGLYGHFAADLHLSPVFAVALGVSGTVQFHPKDEFGSDKSILGVPFLRIRSGVPITPRLKLGGEIRIVVPGEKAPSLAWSGTTMDLSLLITVMPKSGHTLAATAGFRLDNSENAAPDPMRTRYGDRVAMQYSSAHAILAGILWMLQCRVAAVWTELSGDILLSDDIAISTVPMRFATGVRYHLNEQIQFHLTTSTSLSRRPDISPGTPLVPIEPRFLGLLGITWKFAFGAKPSFRNTAGNDPAANTRTSAQMQNDAEAQPASDTSQDTQGAAGSETETAGTVASTVRDVSGLPVAGAAVTVVSGEFEVHVTTNRRGQFSVSGVPLGKAEIVVEMPFFETSRTTIAVSGDGQSEVALPVLVESEVGSQIRGLVRNLAGKGVVATITVTPDKRQLTTNSDGEFQLDVEPGSYTVTVRAPGYRNQRRVVKVGNNSVEILNVELRKK